MRCTDIYPPPSVICAKDFVFDLQLFAEGEKTEEPTSKKRADARKKGQVAKSQELNTAFVLLMGFFVLRIMWESIYGNIVEYTVYIYGHLVQTMDTETVRELIIGIILLLFKTSMPIMIAILLIGLAVNFYQVGLAFNTDSLQFNLGKLDPIKGFSKIISKRSLVELLKSLMKIAIIGFFLARFMKEQLPFIPQFIYYDLGTSLEKIADIIFAMAFQVIAVIMILGVIDLAYQKWQTTQDLKMTKQEVKEEMKQSEGDPQIKGKRRQKQREMAMARMMQQVPQADVIITNPTHYAVALKYDKTMAAPQVVAKGQDFVARRIKEIARENSVAIVENKPLARTLFATVEVGDLVPPELYQAVAEVLAYVYRLKKRRRGYA
ncbi:MAG: flagellar biosynthesis protein FlhB [Selenomonadaceae bacterium]|nr:flagellar biosynthesis protein FlhB [Selenomonadaceae bacterium]